MSNSDCRPGKAGGPFAIKNIRPLTAIASVPKPNSRDTADYRLHFCSTWNNSDASYGVSEVSQDNGVLIPVFMH
jgi:hypothetical protein